MHDHRFDGDKIDNFEVALRMRDFEISQLTTRNNFFMIFQGVLFAGLVQSAHSKPIVSLAACLAGFAVALFQIGVASGAKFWQEYWEQMLSDFEKAARNGTPELFHEENSRYLSVVSGRMRERAFSGFTARLVLARFSVSRIPIYVGIALAAIWAVLVLCALRAYPPFAIPSFVVGF